MSKLFGRVKIRANGKVYNTERGATLDPGGIKRESRPGSNSTSGYTEELVPSTIEATLLFGEGDSVTEINKLTDAVIMFELDTGQTYVVRNGYSAEPVQLTEGEGKAKVVFKGEAAEELQ